MVAIGVNDDGYCEVIGTAEGYTESSECWQEFLSRLKSRGFSGVRLFAGDKAGAIDKVFPNAVYRRCIVYFYRNVLSKVPKSKRCQAAAMFKVMHVQESFGTSMEKTEFVADSLESSKLKETASCGVVKTLTYTCFPMEHWRRIRTNNAIELSP